VGLLSPFHGGKVRDRYDLGEDRRSSQPPEHGPGPKRIAFPKGPRPRTSPLATPLNQIPIDTAPRPRSISCIGNGAERHCRYNPYHYAKLAGSSFASAAFAVVTQPSTNGTRSIARFILPPLPPGQYVFYVGHFRLELSTDVRHES
jgi:hypothetical protein